MMRRAACKAANPLKIRASLGRKAYGMPLFYGSQSLKDQGKSRTEHSRLFQDHPQVAIP